MLRALTELGQMLAWTQPGERRANDPETERWLDDATLENQPHLAPILGARRGRASDFPVLAGDDIRDDVVRCRRSVEALGHELLVLDQTRPEIGMPVAKVVVPGLRHCRARLAPGRLYDVPVKLGWLPARCVRSSSTPLPMVL